VNFERTAKLWKKKGRESEPPYFGWLSTSITGYPETVGLKTNVHTRPVGERPYVELEPTDHTGDRREFSISGNEYGMLAEGDEGRLTYQGTRYRGFERGRV
jgi:Uncharacterized protein conserved in bacteria (DUF2199)/Protein of unknown function (DUF2500)